LASTFGSCVLQNPPRVFSSGMYQFFQVTMFVDGMSIFIEFADLQRNISPANPASNRLNALRRHRSQPKVAGTPKEDYAALSGGDVLPDSACCDAPFNMMRLASQISCTARPYSSVLQCPTGTSFPQIQQNVVSLPNSSFNITTPSSSATPKSSE